MKKFLEKDKNTDGTLKNFSTFIYTINCKNGETTIKGHINTYTENGLASINPTENAGNMIRSKYLSIKNRKLPENGSITERQSLLLKVTNISLENFKIQYNYKYL